MQSMFNAPPANMHGLMAGDPRVGHSSSLCRIASGTANASPCRVGKQRNCGGREGPVVQRTRSTLVAPAPTESRLSRSPIIVWRSAACSTDRSTKFLNNLFDLLTVSVTRLPFHSQQDESIYLRAEQSLDRRFSVPHLPGGGAMPAAATRCVDPILLRLAVDPDYRDGIAAVLKLYTARDGAGEHSQNYRMFQFTSSRRPAHYVFMRIVSYESETTRPPGILRTTTSSSTRRHAAFHMQNGRRDGSTTDATRARQFGVRWRLFNYTTRDDAVLHRPDGRRGPSTTPSGCEGSGHDGGYMPVVPTRLGRHHPCTIIAVTQIEETLQTRNVTVIPDGVKMTFTLHSD
ncbi:hypothetical protein BV898_07961 [Hypsibius exemplaris]|uniref:Uncharacterized protein n=1 Tax=Hypsibius exemplaris TaxID=2072580 RepID=A0A1W0WS50_HYPEX|nr:hypothetical protein BV898_07961 [Hypsibius exemplaris]